MNIQLTININLSSIMYDRKDDGSIHLPSIAINTNSNPVYEKTADDIRSADPVDNSPAVEDHPVSEDVATAAVAADDDLPADPIPDEPQGPNARQAPKIVDPGNANRRSFSDNLPSDPEERKRERKRRYNAAYRDKVKAQRAASQPVTAICQPQSTAVNQPSDASACPPGDEPKDSPSLTQDGLVPAAPVSWSDYRKRLDEREHQARIRRVATHAVMTHGLKPGTQEMEAFLAKQDEADRPLIERSITGMFPAMQPA